MPPDPVMAGLAQIEKRLDSVDQSIADVHGRVTELAGKMERHLGRSEEVHKMVLRHEKAIDGNDNEGLRTRMAVLEGKQKAIGDPVRRSVVAQRTSAGSLIVAVVTAIGAGIAAWMSGK